MLTLAIVWPAARRLLHLGLPSWPALALALARVTLAAALAAVASRLVSPKTAHAQVTHATMAKPSP